MGACPVGSIFPLPYDTTIHIRGDPKQVDTPVKNPVEKPCEEWMHTTITSETDGMHNMRPEQAHHQ